MAIQTTLNLRTFPQLFWSFKICHPPKKSTTAKRYKRDVQRGLSGFSLKINQNESLSRRKNEDHQARLQSDDKDEDDSGCDYDDDDDDDDEGDEEKRGDTNALSSEVHHVWSTLVQACGAGIPKTSPPTKPCQVFSLERTTSLCVYVFIFLFLLQSFSSGASSSSSVRISELVHQ